MGNNTSTLSTLTIGKTSGTNTFAAVIGIVVNTNLTSQSNNIAVVKTGGSTQILSGANSYTGGTSINGGTLALGSADALGTTGTISFGGGTLQYSSSNTTDYSARFSNANSQAYRIDTNGQTVSLAANLTSSGGSLTKLGTGTLTLSGSNSYTGGTTVNAGTLTVSGSGTLGAATGSLSVNNTNTTGPGTAVVLNLSATSPTTVGSLSGTIATPTSGTNTVTINNGGQLFTVNQSGNTSYAGVIAGNGGLTKSGTGTLTLTGANTYTGTTTIDAGTLVVNGSLASGSAVTVNSGGTLGGSGTVAGTVTIATGGTIAPGNSPGTMTYGSLSEPTSVDLNGTYAFELATAGVSASISTGGSSPALPHTNHDVIKVFGTLDLTDSTVTVTSLGSLGSTGFNNAQSYSWLIANATGGITGTPTLGTVSGADFTSLGGGSFSLTTSTNNLYLNFTPVPEPATVLALGAVGLGAVEAVRRWRRGTVGPAVSA